MYNIPEFGYSYEEENWVRKNLLDQCQSFTFSYKKAKIKVWHIGKDLIYAQQTASGDPVCLCLAGDKRKHFITEIGGLRYHYPVRGGSKIKDALQVLEEAWKVDPSPEHLYYVIGKRSGHCAKCGCTLTVPESMERGIGPECIKHIDGKAWEVYVMRLRASEAKK